MKRSAACGVIALALFATALTRSASADTPADAPTPSAAAPLQAHPTAAPDAPTLPVATPLQVRPSAPLVLEPAPSGPGFGWKVLALTIAAGCGFWIWKKRTTNPADKRVPELRILGRTSAGPRCELLLIELEGQRLLLGVTPQSVNNLYIIADPPPEDQSAPVKENAIAAPARRAKNAPQEPDAVEGQARGLLSNGERL